MIHDRFDPDAVPAIRAREHRKGDVVLRQGDVIEKRETPIEQLAALDPDRFARTSMEDGECRHK
ncbi:hypothetical protein [Paraburkholderia sacchari]|uniref:hypothetical protein n=1 Tax=Paraburkholderia sacchari TaxID=159450 RepID=UPI003D9845F1